MKQDLRSTSEHEEKDVRMNDEEAGARMQIFSQRVYQFQILPHRTGWSVPRADLLRIGLIELVGLAVPRPRQAIDHRVSTRRVFLQGLPPEDEKD